jgi:hypothetical protein
MDFIIVLSISKLLKVLSGKKPDPREVKLRFAAAESVAPQTEPRLASRRISRRWFGIRDGG